MFLINFLLESLLEQFALYFHIPKTWLKQKSNMKYFNQRKIEGIKDQMEESRSASKKHIKKLNLKVFGKVSIVALYTIWWLVQPNLLGIKLFKVLQL